MIPPRSSRSFLMIIDKMDENSGNRYERAWPIRWFWSMILFLPHWYIYCNRYSAYVSSSIWNNNTYSHTVVFEFRIYCFSRTFRNNWCSRFRNYLCVYKSSDSVTKLAVGSPIIWQLTLFILLSFWYTLLIEGEGVVNWWRQHRKTSRVVCHHQEMQYVLFQLGLPWKKKTFRGKILASPLSIFIIFLMFI